MKKNLYFTIWLLAFGLMVQAQNQKFSVKSFEPALMDMTASSLEDKRIDQNGETAALIKIVTTERGFTFEAGALGVVDSQQRTGEVWVWVPRASRKITIMHQKLGVLRDYRYPIEIQAERTYIMVLDTEEIPSPSSPQGPQQQYLAFQITPPNATLEVEGKFWSVEADGSALDYVNFGTYEWHVQAANYHPDAGRVTVNDPDNTQVVTVNLKPNFGWIEVAGTGNLNDASIYIDNTLVGKAPFKSEAIKSGTHDVRIVKKMYAAYSETVTVSDDQTTHIAPTLTADFAEVTLTVDADAEIWVNNEKKGVHTWKGPLGSGTYKIECKLANHEPTVTSKEITPVMTGQTITLPAPKPICGSLMVESNPSFANLYVDGKDLGNTPKSINEILIGQHTLRVSKEGYADYTETITIAKGERKQVKAIMSKESPKIADDTFNGTQSIHDGEYIIRLAQNPNYVLTLKDGKANKNTVVELSQWNNTNSQKWKVTRNGDRIVIRCSTNNNLVFDIYGGTIRNGSQIQVFDYHGGVNQLWIAEKQSNGSYVLMTVANKAFALDNFGGYVRNGNKIELWGVNKGNAQQWIFEEVSNASNSGQLIPEGEYVIRLAQSSNYVLTLKDGKANKNTVVELSQWNNSNAQKWRVTRNGDRIVIRCSTNNNLVFDIYGGTIRNGSQIQVFDYHGGVNQLWIAERQSNGSYVLMTVANKAFALDNYGGYVRNGNKIELWDVNKGGAQQWLFEKLGN